MPRKPPPPPPAPLRPSHEIYQKLRWDPKYAQASLVVGFDHHTGALKEVPFHQFVPGGDVPWHRIWYFRSGEVMLWDRRSRVDRVMGSGVAGADLPAATVVAPTATVASDRTPGAAHRFDPSSGEWKPEDEAAEAASSGPVRLVVLNVLADTYDAEKLRTAERWAALLARLEGEDADLVALTEVTRSFAQRLLATPWARARYATTALASDPHLGLFGAVLLSRWPVRRVEWVATAEARPSVVAELAWGLGLRVAVVHLPSNRRGPKTAERAQQLDAVLDVLHGGDAAPALPTLLVGDFNAPEAEPLPPRARALADAWTSLHPGEPGFTFDPSRNAIAGLNSAHGLAGRLDRVLVGGPAGALVARSSALWSSDEVAPGLFVSDHFGLRCDLAPEAQPMWRAMSPGLAKATPTYHTALVVMPPEGLWGPIQAIRKGHDRSFERWMPHLNVLYGFVPPEHLDEAAELAREVLEAAAPFEVSLDHLDSFEHRASATVFAAPRVSPDGALQKLQAQLARRFPRCDEQGSKSAAGYTPHLTLAQFGNASLGAMKGLLAQWQAAWRPLRFPVAELCIIRRTEDTPFEVVHRLPLGRREEAHGPLAAWLVAEGRWPGPDEERRVAGAVQQLEATAGGVLHGEGGPEVLHLFGSAAIGTRAAGGDVDLVAIGPDGISAVEFFDQLVGELPAGAVTGRVDEARVPVLKLVLDGVQLDLAYAAEHDPDAARTRSGVDDAQVLKQHLGQGLPGARRTALRALRAWAKARRVEGTHLGFPGGLAWSVLFCRALADAPAARHEAAELLLVRAFEWLAARDPRRPVALTEEGDRARPAGKQDMVMVMTPSSPTFNSTRTFTESTAAVLQRELARAVPLAKAALGSGDWAPLFQPLDLRRAFGSKLELVVAAADAAALARAWGWVSSATPRWVVLLEQALGTVWPLGAAERPGERALVLGLTGAAPEDSRTALQKAVLAHLAQHGLADVQVRVDAV
jgi:poly(A) polymerase